MMMILPMAKASSIHVNLGVPYHQISGDVKIESYSYSPFAATWEGITKIYHKNRFLYSLNKYFSYYTAVSKDGKDFYEIYFQFEDDVSICHYRNGLKIDEIKPSYIRNLLQEKDSSITHRFWSLYHLDQKNYVHKRGKLTMLDFFGKFKNNKIRKVSQVNDFIFVKENVLFVKSLNDKFICLDLSTGMVYAKNVNYLLSFEASAKNSLSYRKIIKYDLLGNGKFPKPQNYLGSFAAFVKKILLDNEIFELSNYKGQVKLYFSIKLRNDGFIEEINFLSIEGKGFEATPEQNLFLAQVLRKTKFYAKNIPKGSEYLTFTSWGGVQAHPILINF